MNYEFMILGAGIMIGAGSPIVFRKEYSGMQWALFWIGVIIAIGGIFI